jgi:hypothetical protein
MYFSIADSSQNNADAGSISFVRRECLVPIEKEGMKINGGMNSDACEEYHVALEKIWGILGLHIEVCISQRSIISLVLS